MLFRKTIKHFLLVTASLAAMTVFAAPGIAQVYHPPMHVGVRCQADFQNGWAPTVDVYPGACSDFIARFRRRTTWISIQPARRCRGFPERQWRGNLQPLRRCG